MKKEIKKTSCVIFKMDTPEIQAQQICKTVVNHVGDMIVRFYNELKRKGFINSFTYKVEVYNKGYQISFVMDFEGSNFLDYMKFRPGVFSEYHQDLLNKIGTFTYFSVEPSSFFNDHFKEGTAEFNANFSALPMTEGSKQSYVHMKSIGSQLRLQETYGFFIDNAIDRLVELGKAFNMNIERGLIRVPGDMQNMMHSIIINK